MRRILPFLMALLLFAGPVSGQQADPVQTRQPIDITSDRLEAEETARQVHFLGQVVARQGNVTLYADEMLVFLQGKGEGIERIEASGNVRIIQGDRVATAGRGVYFNREGRIVLTGDPKIHQGENFVSGDEITVFLEEEKSIVRSTEGSRVRATFQPKGEGR